MALTWNAVQRAYSPDPAEYFARAQASGLQARRRTAQNGFRDERQEVMNHWQEAKTWMRSPIVLAGDLLQTALQYELIVGSTRLGNLLGALDRQDVPESAQHAIWLGRQI